MRLSFVFLALIVLLLSACSGGTAAAQLPEGEWTLTSLMGSPPLEGSTVTIRFEGNQVSGSAGCNSYGGQFNAGRDGSLTFDNVFSTEMACMEPEGLMEQETTYLQTLTQAASFTIADGQLELMNQAGETIMVFSQ